MLFDLNNFHQFYWADLYYIDFEIGNSFDALRRLNINQEKTLSESRTALEQKVQSILASSEGEDQYILNSFIHQETYDEEILMDEIERLQRNSLIMSIFSFYEARLKFLCNMIENAFALNIKLVDLNTHKGDLMKYWTYLSKVYQLNTEELQPLFDPLNRQKKLRNIIAHYDGAVSNKQKNEVPETPGISFKQIEDLYYLQVEEHIYIEYLLKEIKSFFELLLKAIDNRFKELKQE